MHLFLQEQTPLTSMSLTSITQNWAAILPAFRQWTMEEAKIKINPKVAVCNGIYSDGTKNAPKVGTSAVTSLLINPSATPNNQADLPSTIQLSVGAMLRVTSAMAATTSIMTIPPQATITHALAFHSDIGYSVFQSCENFKLPVKPLAEVFVQENLRLKNSNGSRLLVDILNSRKLANSEKSPEQKFIMSDTVFTMCFILHQKLCPGQPHTTINKLDVETPGA